MKKKTNVVIIMADQLRYDVLCETYTPNIVKLAEEGVMFHRAYCASPLCVPARGSVFTGRYPNVTGSIINPWEKADKKHGEVHAGMANLYEMMENDWDSWNIGKQHFITEDKISDSPGTKTHWVGDEKEYRQFLALNGKRAPGGSSFRGLVPELALGRLTHPKYYSIPTTGCYEEGFDYYFDGYFINQALKAIRNRDRSKPMLLNLMMLAPHPPLDIPEPWFSKIREAKIPDNVGRWCQGQSPLQLYHLPGVIGSRYTREDWLKIWPVYLGLVSLLDDCVGMLVEELKAQGMYEDTLIVFTSDHGEMLGSHCLWQKMCMYEESVRTPLYIKFPKDYIPSHTEIPVPVSAVDILPTLCDFLGMDIPEDVNGISLMPLIDGKIPKRENIYIQFDGNGGRGNFQRCVIQGNYKLIVDIFKDETYYELYDVVSDPQEQNNLAFLEENKTRAMHMLKDLRLHMKLTGDLIKIPGGSYLKFIEDYGCTR